MRFTHFYSANPVCSPSRAALLTGRYPTRVGVPRVLFPTDTTGLPDSETTIAADAQGAGYARPCASASGISATCRSTCPRSRGFDEYFGIPYSNDMTPRVLLHNTEIVEEPATLETLTPRYTEQALHFIERSKDSPFFLYMPHTYPHIPLARPTRFRGKSNAGLYGDVVEEIDWSVGEVLGALKKHGLDKQHAGHVLVRQRPVVPGQPGPVARPQGHDLGGRRCASRSWRASRAASQGTRSATAWPRPWTSCRRWPDFAAPRRPRTRSTASTSGR